MYHIQHVHVNVIWIIKSQVAWVLKEGFHLTSSPFSMFGFSLQYPQDMVVYTQLGYAQWKGLKQFTSYH